MTSRFRQSTLPNRQGPVATRSLRGALAGIALASIAMALAMASQAHAGTYVINNCPAAPTPNGDSGPWTIFGGPQGNKSTCSGGSGEWIGPRGGSMSPGSIDGVQVTVPAGSGVMIREAKIWWYVPQQISGATTFAIASSSGGIVGESATPLENRGAPSVLMLPSTTSSLTLADYCSNDDAGQGCTFGGGVNPNLELFGSQLTLEDSRLPTGSITGGALASSGTLSGVQSLSYHAEDIDSGVRVVRLLIDGQPAAENDYLSKCPYTNFQACRPSESDTISWATASVADGAHNVELTVEDAAQNTAVIYDGTITTDNAPVNTSAPAISAPEQVLPGGALAADTGTWSAPAGSGSVTYGYQWQECDSQGESCQSIGGAQNASYVADAGDVGHSLRVLVSAADADGLTSAVSAATSPVATPQLAPAGPTGGVDPFTTSSPGPGVPNGSGASATAQLVLNGARSISRSFAQRAFTLTGRLTDGQGQPIAGAVLDVLAQTGSGTARPLTQAETLPDGSFLANVPAGPSRQVLVAYRAFAADPGYTTVAQVQESVSAGMRLSINPRQIASHGTITLTGTVQGPIPAHGIIVELLVHYRGRWEPFRTPRTAADGHFKVLYQFEGAVGRFPFRAEVPEGQAGFPYTTGYSNTVDVSSG